MDVGKEMRKCHDLGYVNVEGESLSKDTADYGFEIQKGNALCVKIGPLWYAGMKIVDINKFVTPPWAGCCGAILPQPASWESETTAGTFRWVASLNIEDAIDLLEMSGFTRILDPKTQIDPVFTNAAGEFTEEMITEYSGNIDKYGCSVSMNPRDFAFESHYDDGGDSNGDDPHFMITPLWYPALLGTNDFESPPWKGCCSNVMDPTVWKEEAPSKFVWTGTDDHSDGWKWLVSQGFHEINAETSVPLAEQNATLAKKADNKYPEAPPSLAELLANLGINVDDMVCPKCGGKTFIDPYTTVGVVQVDRSGPQLKKICAHCLNEVMDPKLIEMIADQTKGARDAAFFFSDMFNVIFVAGSRTPEPYDEAVTKHFGVEMEVGECIEAEEGAYHRLFDMTPEGLASVEFFIPPRKYEDAEGNKLQWNVAKRFVAIGRVIPEKEGSHNRVFEIDFLGSEERAEEDAKVKLRPQPLQFSDIKFMVTSADNGTVVAENNALLRSVYSKGFVVIGLDDTIREIEADTPSAEKWYLVACHTFEHGDIEIITDGNRYYNIEDSDGSKKIYARKDKPIGFGEDDQKLLKCLITYMANKDEESEEDWPTV